jgi:hypothetical protein
MNMKRTDAFMLGITTFVAANCISYFVLSDAPYVTGWGQRPGWYDFFEVIGFPFVMFGAANTQMSSSSINCLGNLVVAVSVSYFFARHVAHRLPPLWAGYCRTFRYSLCGLLVVTTVVCFLLGIAMAGPGWGLTVRNLTCLGGPPVIYAWYLYRRAISWTWLAAVSVGLTLLVLPIDCRYDPFMDMIVSSGLYWYYGGLHFIAQAIIRAVVPILGLLSSFVIVHAAYEVVRNRTAFTGTRTPTPTPNDETSQDQ